MTEFFDFFENNSNKNKSLKNKEFKGHRDINIKNKLNSSDDDESEDENFTRALNKKVFQGKKGEMLLELQKSFKDDKRFEMGNKFRGDIDVSKVSQKLKEMTYTFDSNKKNHENMHSTINKLFKYNDIEQKVLQEKNKNTTEDHIIVDNLSIKNFNEHLFKEKIEEEKLNNLAILSRIISNQEFLSLTKKINNPNQLILKRFDPNYNIGQNLVVDDQKKISEYINKENIIKLDKGMEHKSDFNIDEEFINKKNKKEIKKLNQLKKHEKENVMKKIANEINDDLEPVIEVNYNIWKNVAHQKQKADISSSFTLFSNNEETIKHSNNTNLFADKNNNNQAFNLFSDQAKEITGFNLFEAKNNIKKEDVKEKTMITEHLNKNKSITSGKEVAEINRKLNKKEMKIENNLTEEKVKVDKNESFNKKKKTDKIQSDNNDKLNLNDDSLDPISKKVLKHLDSTKEKPNKQIIQDDSKESETAEKEKNNELLKKKIERIKQKKQDIKNKETKKRNNLYNFFYYYYIFFLINH